MAEKRFIDANGSYTLIATDNTGYGLCFGGGIISIINWHGSVVAEFYADDAPAADVVEVVHARWNDRDGKTWCSNCDASNKQYKPPYCPHCGACMDGERKEA